MITKSIIPEFLPDNHRMVLEWFLENTGKITGWPKPLQDGSLLASKAKGIYKPKWSQYALSVRQNINGPYPDVPPVRKADGSWLYCYFQEDLDPESRDSAYTNIGLMNCMNDAVPVGVFRQVKLKPDSQYYIEGVAFVATWADGFFTFEGVSADGKKYENQFNEAVAGYHTVSDIDSYVLQSESGILLDARKKIAGLIVTRQGQPKFRKEVLSAYQSICAITKYDAKEVLEAAHILPYRGDFTDHIQNGLLLRADIHNLFDLGLITVNTSDMNVVLSKKLIGTKYEILEGVELQVPHNRELQPSLQALRHHAKWSGII
jgi:hypothetical protein